MVDLLDDKLAARQMPHGKYFAGLFFHFLLSGLDGVQKLTRRLYREEGLRVEG